MAFVLWTKFMMHNEFIMDVTLLIKETIERKETTFQIFTRKERLWWRLFRRGHQLGKNFEKSRKLGMTPYSHLVLILSVNLIFFWPDSISHVHMFSNIWCYFRQAETIPNLPGCHTPTNIFLVNKLEYHRNAYSDLSN